MSRNSPQSCPPRFLSAAKSNSSRHRKQRGFKQSFKRRLRYFYWRLVRLRGRPEVLARGLACGVFAGLFPFFGSQTLLGVLLAIIFRGNKILAVVGPWISNPFTSVPIYAFNFHVGKWLLNDHSSTQISLQSWQDVKELGLEIIWPLFLGCVVVGLVCAICSYFLGLWLIRRVRASNQQRHRHRALKRLHERYPEQ
jgi:hypothetical protein